MVALFAPPTQPHTRTGLSIIGRVLKHIMATVSTVKMCRRPLDVTGFDENELCGDKQINCQSKYNVQRVRWGYIMRHFVPYKSNDEIGLEYCALFVGLLSRKSEV